MKSVNGKFGEFVGQDLSVKAGMDKGAEQHIAADPGEAIGIGNARRR